MYSTETLSDTDKQSEEFNEPHYYSLYLLKANRIKSSSKESDETKSSDDNKSLKQTTVVEFLQKEAMYNRDFSITLILNSLSGSNEALLRENIAKKIEKCTLYATNGTIGTFDLGFKSKDDTAIQSICFFILYRQNVEPNNEYVLCLTMQNSAFNLDLFRNELDLFVSQSLTPWLEQTVLNIKEVERLLRNWFYRNILYLNRCSTIFNDDISIIFDNAFTCSKLELIDVDKSVANDINLFFFSCNCTDLVAAETRDTSTNEQSSKDKESGDFNKKLTIIYIKQSDSYEFSSYDSSDFSKECTQKFVKAFKDPFSKKQIIENYKLKLIQDLNTFNRRLRRAETNYYELYAAYLYIKNNQIGKILLKIYENCVTETNLVNLFKIIRKFLNENEQNMQQ